MPHHSHDSESKISLVISGILLALFVITVNINWPDLGFLLNHLNVIHAFVEIVVIVIACMTFTIVWGIRDEKPSPSLVLFACALLCVAILDFIHMLSYRGMPDFITPGSREKSIYFWQAAHLLGSLALLVVAIKPARNPNPKITFATALPASLLLTAAIIWLYFGVLAKQDNFYLYGNNFTDIKLYIEYFLIAINFLAAGIYLRRMFKQRLFNTSALFAAAFILGLGEYYYTIYSSTTDFYNLLGHIYKIIGFGFIYWAVFVETLRNPYRQLRESRGQLRATMQAMPDLIFELDSDYRFINNYSAKTDGLYVPESEFMGKTIAEVMPLGVADLCIKALDDARDNGISTNNIICLPIDNYSRWFEISISAKPVADGKDLHFVAVSRDVTERMENEKALRVLSHAFSQSPIAFFITDVNHVIELCNQSYARICNANISDLIGKFPFEVSASLSCQRLSSDVITTIEQGKTWQGELINQSASGDEIVLQALIFPVRNSSGEVTNYITHMEDITEKKHSENRIRQLSQFDQLTNLPNTALLQKHFEILISQKFLMAVLWLDIDNFKEINDSFGHHVGDDLLRKVANRLNYHTDTDSMISRLSGDDFLVIKTIKNQADATVKANNIANLFAKPISLSGQDIYITLSIGVALCPDDGVDFDVLLKNAESAKYKAKNLGRNNICYFKHEMQTNAARFLELSNSLKQAHLHDEMRMVYHPQFNIENQAMVGVEALIRWRSPKWGNIEPEEFIRMAEANGAMIALGDWILETVIKQISVWHKQGLSNITVAINLSPIQFNSPDLINTISDLLNRYDVDPACITLEITEAMAMNDSPDVINRMKELQALNIKFAIDDFGTGYSSLSYLKRFRIHQIKIDRSFVRDINSDDDDKAIVNAIIQMAKQLDIKVTAEGIETLDQLYILAHLGCDEAQGFYLSKPLEVDQVFGFVKKHAVNN